MYSEQEHLWSAKPNRRLVAEVGELRPGQALDLACGEGQNAVWLATLGWDVLGVDFSEVAIAKARRRAAAEGLDVEFVCADLVVVLFLHFDAEERGVVLPRAADALAPGGTLLLIGHDRTNLTDGVGGPSDASVLYTPEDVVSDLEGLQIERAERVLRDVAGADRPAIDALVRAHAPVSAPAQG